MFRSNATSKVAPEPVNDNITTENKTNGAELPVSKSSTRLLVYDGESIRERRPNEPFAAISYVWGPPTHKILVPAGLNQRADSTGQLQTQWSSLHRLDIIKHLAKRCPVWVDQLCNEVESPSYQMMGQFTNAYTEARSVYVLWDNMTTREIREGLKLVEKLHSCRESVWTMNDETLNLKQSEDYADLNRFVEKLKATQWFDRVWTFQELVQATFIGFVSSDCTQNGTFASHHSRKEEFLFILEHLVELGYESFSYLGDSHHDDLETNDVYAALRRRKCAFNCDKLCAFGLLLEQDLNFWYQGKTIYEIVSSLKDPVTIQVPPQFLVTSSKVRSEPYVYGFMDDLDPMQEQYNLARWFLLDRILYKCAPFFEYFGFLKTQVHQDGPPCVFNVKSVYLVGHPLGHSYAVESVKGTQWRVVGVAPMWKYEWNQPEKPFNKVVILH
ncbi:hypothetical protein BC830DRAFT_1078965 [Chytriomyces sp. MP71]|nr:hypothetical protein BC830DRAFT_1078965 [Chytriomyces sp. MP71]